MRDALIFLLIVASNVSGCSLTTSAQHADLYRCEGCEAIHEHSFDGLTWSTTIPGADEPGEPLVLTGTVYQVDGKTPAPGVIIYAHQTNAEGVYPKRGNEKGWARRHGYLRAWVKTDAEGRYRFRTIRPGSYPGRNAPAHIHLIVKEPGLREYWIDDVIFDDDPLVTDAVRNRRSNRGGTGIVVPKRSDDGVQHVERDVILERHPE